MQGAGRSPGLMRVFVISMPLPSASLGSVMDRWPNFVLPAIMAVLAVRLLYVYVSKATSPQVLIVFIRVIVLLPGLIYLAAHAVGFSYDLFGVEPSRQTRAFNTGWETGITLTGRTGRQH